MDERCPPRSSSSLSRGSRPGDGPIENAASTSGAFRDLPERLRSSLARLIGADASQVVLANSASYGLHLMANGLELGEGDEVLVAANDFPSDILPRLRLRRYGVTVNQVSPVGRVLTSEEVAEAISPRTRVVCLTWVHSCSGQIVDLDTIGGVCRDADVLFVMGQAQALEAAFTQEDRKRPSSRWRGRGGTEGVDAGHPGHPVDRRTLNSVSPESTHFALRSVRSSE